VSGRPGRDAGAPLARTLILLAGGLVLLAAGAATAHRLDVVRVTLTERTEERYSLEMAVTPGLERSVSAPVGPERCVIRADGQDGLARFELVCPGGLRADDRLELDWSREGALVTARWRDGVEVARYFPRERGTVVVRLGELRAGSGSLTDAARRYFGLGVVHILLGLDHLLFVTGLLFLVTGAWPLVKTVTAFTLAHSLTLALAVLGVVQVSSRSVDAVVALSIVFVGAEIVRCRRGGNALSVRRPWIVAFAFGLLHGLGFAGALNALGLPPREIPAALLFFNLGVEAGQLSFVAAVLALRAALGALRVSPPAWAGPLPGYALGIVAAVWLIRRLDPIVSALLR